MKFFLISQPQTLPDICINHTAKGPMVEGSAGTLLWGPGCRVGDKTAHNPYRFTDLQSIKTRNMADWKYHRQSIHLFFFFLLLLPIKIYYFPKKRKQWRSGKVRRRGKKTKKLTWFFSRNRLVFVNRILSSQKPQPSRH